jgi:glycosyltransferase involved in cell wall biosynthesis
VIDGASLQFDDKAAAPTRHPHLVSVVLPTYNRAHLLGNAMRSVLGQTYRGLELIIVDDNSKDDTAEVVRSFDDPRIRYLRNEQNLKLPGGLNRGFAASRGDFLTWTSDDNLYANTAIERMVEVLQQGECDFVFTDYFHFTDLDEASGEPLNVQHIRLSPTLELERRNSVGASFLYTRAVYEGVGLYDPELFLVEDYDYFIRVHKRFRIRHLAEPLYYFRRHDDALFCSRYAEVQAAGVLVRYKNELITEEEVTEACVGLVIRNAGALSNRLLRGAYSGAKRTSIRLSNLYECALRAYVRIKIGRNVEQVLDNFASRALSFAEARDSLRALLQDVATIEYK